MLAIRMATESQIQYRGDQKLQDLKQLIDIVLRIEREFISLLGAICPTRTEAKIRAEFEIKFALVLT
jgi:hypothetical protein